MSAFMPLGFSKSESMDHLQINYSYCTKEQATQANVAFDELVKTYLRHWIEQGTVQDTDRRVESETDIDAFIQQGALRSFFKHHTDALEQLLQQDDIARHLLRPSTQVFFEPDAYEPLLAQFETRIYNLAAHREHREVPFRYSPASRQGDYGDSVGLDAMPPGEIKEDIGLYFGTRRSDTTALNLLARQLRHEAVFSVLLPIHVVTEGYMEDSLRLIRKMTEELRDENNLSLHCFVVQRRHAVDDRHLGAALLLMNPSQPDLPQRIVFCDTLKINSLPPWWDKFKRQIDLVFPQPTGNPAASSWVEDGGVNLQRLHDGVPVRHQDIDCAFYTASMGRALIQVAKVSPECIISGSIDELIYEMTARMPEYFEQGNVAKASVVVRQINVVRRWQTGQEALADYQQRYVPISTIVMPAHPETDNSGWSSADSSSSGVDLPSAA